MAHGNKNARRNQGAFPANLAPLAHRYLIVPGLLATRYFDFRCGAYPLPVYSLGLLPLPLRFLRKLNVMLLPQKEKLVKPGNSK